MLDDLSLAKDVSQQEIKISDAGGLPDLDDACSGDVVISSKLTHGGTWHSPESVDK